MTEPSSTRTISRTNCSGVFSSILYTVRSSTESSSSRNMMIILAAGRFSGYLRRLHLHVIKKHM